MAQSTVFPTNVRVEYDRGAPSFLDFVRSTAAARIEAELDNGPRGEIANASDADPYGAGDAA